MCRGFVPLLILLGSSLLAFGADEKAPSKTSPVVAGGIQRAIVFDPKAREKALAKAAEERPTDVIFLQEVVVLAPRNDRRVGQALSWQEQMMAASKFSFQNGGSVLKVPMGAVGVWKHDDVMPKESAFSTKQGSPRVDLFRINP